MRLPRTSTTQIWWPWLQSLIRTPNCYAMRFEVYRCTASGGHSIPPFTSRLHFRPDGALPLCLEDGPIDAAQVISLLRLRGVLDRVEVVEIAGRSEWDAAELMRSCRLFSASVNSEGLVTPAIGRRLPADAWSGISTGHAGAEFFRRRSPPRSRTGTLRFAAEAERLLAWTEEDPLAARQAALDGSQYVLHTYSSEVEQRDLVGLFQALLQ